MFQEKQVRRNITEDEVMLAWTFVGKTSTWSLEEEQLDRFNSWTKQLPQRCPWTPNVSPCVRGLWVWTCRTVKMKQGVAEKEHARSASLLEVRTGKKSEDEKWKHFLAKISTQDNRASQNQIAYVNLDRAVWSQTPVEIQQQWTLCQCVLKLVCILSPSPMNHMSCFVLQLACPYVWRRLLDCAKASSCDLPMLLLHFVRPIRMYLAEMLFASPALSGGVVASVVRQWSCWQQNFSPNSLHLNVIVVGGFSLSNKANLYLALELSCDHVDARGFKMKEAIITICDSSWNHNKGQAWRWGWSKQRRLNQGRV